MLLHKQRMHWTDYLNPDKLRSFELLAAEGMIGRHAGAERE